MRALPVRSAAHPAASRSGFALAQLGCITRGIIVLFYRRQPVLRVPRADANAFEHAGILARPSRPICHAVSGLCRICSIGQDLRNNISPVSIPSSICMMVMPVSLSPARIARCIGAAPRQRGNREAWIFRQPWRGKLQHRFRQDQTISGHHHHIRTQCGDRSLYFFRL